MCYQSYNPSTIWSGIIFFCCFKFLFCSFIWVHPMSRKRIVLLYFLIGLLSLFHLLNSHLWICSLVDFAALKHKPISFIKHGNWEAWNFSYAGRGQRQEWLQWVPFGVSSNRGCDVQYFPQDRSVSRYLCLVLQVIEGLLKNIKYS
jgi:hypothetical protein